MRAHPEAYLVQPSKSHGSATATPGRVPDGEDIAPGFETVARADIAEFMLDVAEHDLYVRELPKVGC